MLWGDPPPSIGKEFDIVVVAASLGGRDVLEPIVAQLPTDFPAPVVVVHHLPPQVPSRLAEFLARRTGRPVEWAKDLTRPRPGRIYLAPPARHLILGRSGVMRLDDGPKVSFARPAADRLFVSAARVFGPRVLAVVLTGRLNDGAEGAKIVRAAGGGVIAQTPESCRAPQMPSAALASGAVHFALPPDRIATALIALTTVPGAAALFGIGRAAA